MCFLVFVILCDFYIIIITLLLLSSSILDFYDEYIFVNFKELIWDQQKKKEREIKNMLVIDRYFEVYKKRKDIEKKIKRKERKREDREKLIVSLLLFSFFCIPSFRWYRLSSSRKWPSVQIRNHLRSVLWRIHKLSKFWKTVMRFV